MIYYTYLAIAIIFEVIGTMSMKLSDGFSKTIPSVSMILFYILSLSLLTMALKKLDVSMAYAIWAGVGTALIAIMGILFFKETLSISKIVAIGLIIVGVTLLHLSSTETS